MLLQKKVQGERPAMDLLFAGDALRRLCLWFGSANLFIRDSRYPSSEAFKTRYNI
jgi:hypothetical protein